MIKLIYSGGSSSIHTGNSSVNIEVEKGVRQGDTLSPILFILGLQSALNRVDWSDGVPIDGRKLGHLDFADDIVLCSRTFEGVQNLLNQVSENCAPIGLEISVEKSKWMTNDRNPDDVLLLDNVEVEYVREFIYLGQHIPLPRVPNRRGVKPSRFNKEIGRRISAGWCSFNKAKHLLKSRRIPMVLKKRYFHQCVLPAMLYGCETWGLTKLEENRLAVAQRRMERTMLNVKLIDRHSREWLRERTQLNDVVQLARKRKWNYLPKILSLPEERWSRVLTRWKPDGNRTTGRPSTRWTLDFEKFLNINHKFLETLYNMSLTDVWSSHLSPFVLRDR